jgi:hypothetical protein
MKNILGFENFNEGKKECNDCKKSPCECPDCCDECKNGKECTCDKNEDLDAEFDFDTLSVEEKKKLPAALQAFIDKKKGKKGGKDDKKDDKKTDKKADKKGGKPKFWEK